MLHKPAGTECSQKPSTYPSIYTLLPSPLRLRPNKGAVQGVQAIGRLDQDTTGLLLLTDDGQFIHRMGSPKHHVPKVYEVDDQASGRRRAGGAAAGRRGARRRPEAGARGRLRSRRRRCTCA